MYLVTVYNFNLALGWASSGVEYAQAYRESIFRKLKIQTKFVFAELILNGNIFDMADRIGMNVNNILPIHFYFTDLKPSISSYTLNKFEKDYNVAYFNKRITPEVVLYEDSGVTVRVVLDDKHENVNYADYIINGYLIRKDHFTYTRTFSEYYTPVDNQAKVHRRVFYNENGTIAYEQLIDQENVLYNMREKILYSEYELVSYFLEKIHPTKQDVLIIDREKYIASAVLKNKNNAKVGVVIHAEHYSSNQTDEEHVVWNNFYEYQFMHADAIDFFVTATCRQKEKLENQFKKYKGITPKIEAIPVGNLDKLRGKRHKRNKNRLITASRLATEKHIDWIVLAIISLHESIPSVVLDIYGMGNQREKIQQIVDEYNADSYINLKGHQDLTEIYKSYFGYVTASQSEGFGLTLMEAVGSGLPMVGYDVPYGNQEFIDNDVNGYLVEYDHKIDQNIKRLGVGIEKLLHTNNYEILKQASYQKAERFLEKNTKILWQKLIEEVTND
ncbi:accessory Sec system glycosyltransferase GtfA [Leuconostoc litchii]|uniref:Accessory Sec system glycosyltransferase GtfA n=1 Tax=Leuconostoc litchii TaxID=1981069 RepID=A0A6P2CJX9_9LACO|nr:accessory Sec system glycosyltransferase GtfA [Leuconostoc litchii]